MTTNLRGILAPALTAVTDNFQIDQDRTIAHYAWLLENGCDGVLVFGTTSEANSFSVAERKRLLEQAVQLAAERLPGIRRPGRGGLFYFNWGLGHH